MRFLMMTLCVLFPSFGMAQESDPTQATSVAAAANDSVQHNFSLTISPIHLALPVVELTGELRVHDKVGVALIIGAGKVSTEATILTPEHSFTAIEAGASARYYVLGNFVHGMQVGAEVVYLYVNNDDDTVTASGTGLSFGPFIGYKIATNVGFTFDAQLGAQYIGAQAEATDGANTATAEESDFGPLLNLNVGWSF